MLRKNNGCVFEQLCVVQCLSLLHLEMFFLIEFHSACKCGSSVIFSNICIELLKFAKSCHAILDTPKIL